MRIGNVIAGIALVASIAAVTVSPIGVPAAIKALEAEEEFILKEDIANAKLQSATSSLIDSVEEFNNSRTFDLYYGDIDKLTEVLSTVAGISVKNVAIVDPMSNFQVVGYYSEGDNPSCVQFELIVESVENAMAVLERMELPVYSVYVEHPNILNVIFLSGGDL